MKKTLCLLLTMLLTVSLFTACGKDDNNDNTNTETPSTETPAATETPASTDTSDTEPEKAPVTIVEDTDISATPFEGSMEALIDAIYEHHNEIEMMIGSIPVSTSDPDDLSYNAGISDASLVSEVYRSEAMMGQAYSLICARVNDAKDAPEVAKMMFDNIDQRKWICVCADTKVAAYCGDIAVFFMVNSEFEDFVSTESIINAFREVCPDCTVIE